MPPFLAFCLGFLSLGLVVMLYLLYQFIQIQREMLWMLKEELKDE